MGKNRRKKVLLTYFMYPDKNGGKNRKKVWLTFGMSIVCRHGKCFTQIASGREITFNTLYVESEFKE